MTPLATVPPAPASASTPWTSSSTFAQPTESVDLASVDSEPMVRTWSRARGSASTRSVTGVTTGGAWILVGPLMYLIARAIHVVRTTGRGAGPAWAYAGLVQLRG